MRFLKLVLIYALIVALCGADAPAPVTVNGPLVITQVPAKDGPAEGGRACLTP